MSETALVTGASSGLGEEFAKILASKGYNLVLVARRKDRLEELAELLTKEYAIKVRVLPADLTDPKTPEVIFKTLQKERIQIDVLINNAGFGTRGKVWELDSEMMLSEIQVNLTSLVQLTRLFLPDMIERKSGKVLNVASTAAFSPGPFMAIYYATKAFVLSFSESLSLELLGTGVTATCLCPGPTKTEFAKNAHINRMSLFQHYIMSASRVAKIGIDGMLKGKSVVIAGNRNKIKVGIGRHLPPMMLGKIVKHYQEVKK